MNGLILVALVVLGYLSFKSFASEGSQRQSLPRRKYRNRVTLDLKGVGTLVAQYLSFGFVYMGYTLLSYFRFISGFYVKGKIPDPIDSLVRLLD